MHQGHPFRRAQVQVLPEPGQGQIEHRDGCSQERQISP